MLEEEEWGSTMIVRHTSKPMHRSVSLVLLFVLASLVGSDVLHGQEGKARITKAEIGEDGLVHLTNSAEENL